MSKRKPFPIEKYHFYRQDNKIYAVSTYAGKTVRAAAKTDPRDEFDSEYGKRLAAARCAHKVAKKRHAAAINRRETLKREIAVLQGRLAKADRWAVDALIEKLETADQIQVILDEAED